MHVHHLSLISTFPQTFSLYAVFDQIHYCQLPPHHYHSLMEVDLSVLYVQTEPQVNIMVYPAVMATRASLGGAFATTTLTIAGKLVLLNTTDHNSDNAQQEQ